MDAESKDARRPLVRDAGADDLQGMTDVFVDAFDRFPLWECSDGPLGFVAWMTERNGPARAYPTLAELDGMVVGTETRHLRDLHVSGVEYAIARGPYSAMHSVARGQGWYRSLRAHRQNDAQGGVNFSQVAQMRHIRPMAQSRTPANPWTIYALILSPWRAAARSGPLARVPALLGYAALAVRGLLGRRRADAGDWEIAEVEAFDERVGELDLAARDDFDVHLKRSPEYLNWRFCDPRGGFYRVLYAERGAELLGYAVYAVHDGRGIIVDLLVRPDHVGVARSLMAAAVDACGRQSVDAVEYWNMDHHPYSGAVRGLGFVRLGRRSEASATRPNFRGADPALYQALAILEDPRARTHLTVGDTELA